MDFLQKARDLMPVIHKSDVPPMRETEPVNRVMGCGDSFVLDFGRHLVGYFTICFEPMCPADSPLELKIRFVEDVCELSIKDDMSGYRGGLSSTWIQNETVYIDIPEDIIRLPRRYAFRYVRVSLPGSTHYKVKYKYAFCTAVTSADESRVVSLPEHMDAQLADIDRVAAYTLRECMQEVFEDGPKRDRRLWLGDLYLQAKANYVTFKNYNLVLRCLYLFAGLTHENGCVSSAVYHEPVLKNQSWILHDYALFFIGTLADYYDATNDRINLEILFPTAFRQAEIAADAANDEGIVPAHLYFVDWCEPLDKTAAAQGIAVAMLKKCLYIAEILHRKEESQKLRHWINKLSDGAMSMYDSSLNLFCGSESRQISVASQMWMILAGVMSNEANGRVLDALAAYPEPVKTVTPYAMHYYIEALISCGRLKEAEQKIKNYWGEMVKLKADCFWEVYVPGNPEASPYGDKRINSFCHAWSCTPTYFIRKYFTD